MLMIMTHYCYCLIASAPVIGVYIDAPLALLLQFVAAVACYVAACLNGKAFPHQALNSYTSLRM